MISRRPLVLLPQLEVSLVIPLPLNSPLIIEVITPLLYCLFYIEHRIIQVHAGGVLAHRHPFFNGRLEFGLEPVHLKPFVSYKSQVEHEKAP